MRGVLDSNNNIPLPFNRSSSFESLPRPTENRSNHQPEDEKKRQAKLRNRAWNESFRQAVDKSYGQTNSQPTVSGKSIVLLSLFVLNRFFFRSRIGRVRQIIETREESIQILELIFEQVS